MIGHDAISLVHSENRVRGTGRPPRSTIQCSAGMSIHPLIYWDDYEMSPEHPNLQPYGRINEITRPQPVPIGVPRSSQVNFRRIRSAVNAHNCVHGLMVSPVEGAPPSQQTRLAVLYERPIKAHVINDWVTSHPRIVLPIVFFLLGTLTYTVRVAFTTGLESVH